MSYSQALKFLLTLEGGYVNDPFDRGGATNYGITQKVYDKYRVAKKEDIQSVKNITDFEVSDIYASLYWRPGKCDLLPNVVSTVHFDSCVNHGVVQASKFLQRSVNVEDDGLIGEQTLKAVADANPIDVVKKYIAQRKIFYHDITELRSGNNKFINGWLNRLDIIRRYVNTLVV